MDFTPIESSIGGLLIGASVALSLVVDGKIAGISGILGPFLRSLISGGLEHALWKALFLAGLVLGGLVNLAFYRSWAFPPALDFSGWRYLLAGLAVGVGTRLGGGCTSGHGLCGLARLSRRSWLGVPWFMIVAGATVGLTRHGLMKSADPKPSWGVAAVHWPPNWIFPLACVGVAVLLILGTVLVEKTRFILSPLAAGTIFGMGLGCSGMTSQAKVLGFLDVGGVWDPSLAFVMGCGLCVTFPAYFWAARESSCPMARGAAFEKPNNSSIDWKLIVGTALFGVGWGLTGICPGPAIAGVIPYATQGYGPGLWFLLEFCALCVAWLGTDRALARFTQLGAAATATQPVAPVEQGSNGTEEQWATKVEEVDAP